MRTYTYRIYITPLLGTDGASAGNSDTTGVTTPDGLELWISLCNTLGSACNNPQNGMICHSTFSSYLFRMYSHVTFVFMCM